MHPVLLHDYNKALVYGNTALLILNVMSHNNKAEFFFGWTVFCGPRPPHF